MTIGLRQSLLAMLLWSLPACGGQPLAPPNDSAMPVDLGVPVDGAAPVDLVAAPDTVAPCKPATTPGQSVLVDCAGRVVLQNDGGGFRPPPPMGSNCHGESLYTLVFATRDLTWTKCKIPSDA